MRRPRGWELQLPAVVSGKRWSARERKRLRKTFATLAAARAWRAEAQTAIRRGTLRAPVATTVREAGEALVEGMRSGPREDALG